MPEANLKIMGFDSPDGGKTRNKIGEFVVDYNPNTFVINNRISYQQEQPFGTVGGDPQFATIPPMDFNIEFTIDGTGVSKSTWWWIANQQDYLRYQIRNLRFVTGCDLNGEKHRPNYLVLLWGTIYIECILTNLSITYNLFARDGTPLRAKVRCNFLERIGSGKGERERRLESPDLTKYVTTRDGDVLPLIVKDKYNDPAYYLQVAKINKLKNFRNIPLGKMLILPPMKDYNEEEK